MSARWILSEDWAEKHTPVKIEAQPRRFLRISGMTYGFHAVLPEAVRRVDIVIEKYRQP